MSLEDLRALAEAATPGPWRVETLVGIKATYHWLRDVNDGAIASWSTDEGGKTGAFIAAANPAAVTALIDELAEYRALGPLPSLRVAIARSEAIDAELDWRPTAPNHEWHNAILARLRSAGHPTEPPPEVWEWRLKNRDTGDIGQPTSAFVLGCWQSTSWAVPMLNGREITWDERTVQANREFAAKNNAPARPTEGEPG